MRLGQLFVSLSRRSDFLWSFAVRLWFRCRFGSLRFLFELVLPVFDFVLLT